VVVTVTDPADIARAKVLLGQCCNEVHVDESARRLNSPASGLADITRVASLFADSGIAVDDLGLQRPSLDDVFLHLTGHRAEVSEESDDAESVDDADRAEEKVGALR
jgi:ABC-2 type transport system ATP-binding protein